MPDRPSPHTDPLLDWVLSHGATKPPVPERRVRPLDEVLAYRNPRVTHRFTTLYRVSTDEAEELFTETRRFL